MSVLQRPEQMNAHLNKHQTRWLTVVVFAVAMAWVESAVVYYLRTLVGRIEPYQPEPLPLMGGLGPVELVRELATLIMLLAVGALAGGTWRSRMGYAAVAFGVWDVCYYVFLRVICGRPHSVLDWDILFLLPLPWWGPVLAPVLIALLMVVWGTIAGREAQGSPRDRESFLAGALNLTGIALALYVFMADSWRVAGQGAEAIRRVLPTRFNWPLFAVAWLMMAAPIIGLWRRNRRADGRPVPEPGASSPEERAAGGISMEPPLS